MEICWISLSNRIYAFAREIKQIGTTWTGRFRTLLTVNFLCEHLQGKIPDGLGMYYTDMYINVYGDIQNRKSCDQIRALHHICTGQGSDTGE